MPQTPNPLESIHRNCFANEIKLKSTQQAGCFDCLNIFSSSSITDWIDDHPHRSAVCPHCGTDAVLADDGTFELSKIMLETLNAHYISQADNPKGDKVKRFTSFQQLMTDHKKGNR